MREIGRLGRESRARNKAERLAKGLAGGSGGSGSGAGVESERDRTVAQLVAIRDDPKQPAAARVAASRSLLELPEHGEMALPRTVREIEAMTTKELVAFIGKCEAELGRSLVEPLTREEVDAVALPPSVAHLDT